MPRAGLFTYPNLAQTTTATELNLVSGGTFARGGTTYGFDRSAQTLTSYATNARRTVTDAVCSASDWTLHADWDIEGGGSVTLVPVMWDDDYLYGYSSADASLLYRCDAVADTCVLAEDHASLNFVRGFNVTLADGTKRLVCYMSNGTLRYSDDNWATRTTCTLTGASSVVASPFGGENGRAQDGQYVCFGTYGNATLNDEIWQSDDYGATWTRRLLLPSNYVTHCHAMSVQDGLWVMDTGDGTSFGSIDLGSAPADTTNDTITSTAPGMSTDDVGIGMVYVLAGGAVLPAGLTGFTMYGMRCVGANTYSFYPTIEDAAANTNKIDITSAGSGTMYLRNPRQFNFVSTDNGETWDLYEPDSISNTGQIVAMQPIGDGIVLSGSDANAQLYKLDTDSWDVGHVKTVQFRNKEDPMYFFCLNQVGGIWYAGSHSNNVSSGNRDAGIWVATDPDGPWTLYARTPDHVVKGFWRYMGAHGGRLWYAHFDGSDLLRFGSVAPAKISSRTGLKLMCERTNIVPATTADMSNSSAWSVASGITKSTVSSGALLTQSLRFVQPITNSYYAYVYVGLTGVATTTAHVVKAWVKANSASTFKLAFNQTSSNLACPPLGEWGLIEAVLTTGASSSLNLFVQAYPHEKDDTTDFELGAIEVYALGSVTETQDWDVGGAASSAETFNWALTLPSDWTLIVDQKTFPYKGAMAASTAFPIITISVGSGEFVQVYYDTTDEKVYFETTDASSPSGSPLESAAVYLTREHPLKLAIRYSGGICRLSIRHPRGGTEHLTGTLTRSGDPLTGSATIYVGDDSGVITLPTTLFPPKYYDSCLSDDAVETLLESA